MRAITLPYPDDFHCHLRDGDLLTRTVPDTTRCFSRAIVMPNLTPPITTLAAAKAYKARILENVPNGVDFTPLMTLYLTKDLDLKEIELGKSSNLIHGIKLYPAGATTNSAFGVKNLDSVKAQLRVMESCGMPLLIHGEVVDTTIDILQRETTFIQHEVRQILDEFPKLTIVLEHISSKETVEFVKTAGKNVAATITPHHLLLNLNDLLADGLRPHHYCKPIVKQIADQEALIAAAISGNAKFFLGTDSAPHTQRSKESNCGCAGIYSAHAAIELYAEVFAKHNALDKLPDFASRFGAEFYGLPLNKKTLTLVEKPWTIPATLQFGSEELIPLYANQTLNWQIRNS